MTIGYDIIRETARTLYDRALKRIPENSKAALENALETESSPSARTTLEFMIKSARRAEEKSTYVCSDAGFPVYFVKIGTNARFEGLERGGDGLLLRRGLARLTVHPSLLQTATADVVVEVEGPCAVLRRRYRRRCRGVPALIG